MELNELTYKIRGAIFEVYNQLGPGLLESIYEQALIKEFELQNIQVRSQVPISVVYKEQQLDIGFRLDILVEDAVIIEIKSVKLLEDVHKKQLLTYLKLSNLKLGFLVNFNSAFLKDKESVIRIING